LFRYAILPFVERYLFDYRATGFTEGDAEFGYRLDTYEP